MPPLYLLLRYLDAMVPPLMFQQVLLPREAILPRSSASWDVSIDQTDGMRGGEVPVDVSTSGECCGTGWMGPW